MRGAPRLPAEATLVRRFCVVSGWLAGTTLIVGAVFLMAPGLPGYETIVGLVGCLIMFAAVAAPAVSGLRSGATASQCHMWFYAGVTLSSPTSLALLCICFYLLRQ